MKSLVLLACVMSAALVCLTPTTAWSELRTVGEGKKMLLVPEQFAPEQRARYELFKVRCTKCHPMARPIAALTTGIAPVTGTPFGHDTVKKYVVKMMRKPNSGISREDAKEILVFLRYALEVAGHKPPQGEASDEKSE